MMYATRFYQLQLGLFSLYHKITERNTRSGKTTSASQIASSIVRMSDDEPFENYLNGNTGPLLDGPTPRLIDEWQLAPRLWNKVRNEVDTRCKFGQFILTGSSVSADRDRIRHTGTGRI